MKVDGSDPTTLDRRTILLPAAGTMELSVKVTDAGSHELTRVFRVTKAPPAAIPATQPPGGEVESRTTTSTGRRIVVTGQTATHATVELSPAGAGDVAWSWAGGSANGPTATVPVGNNATVPVTAAYTTTPTKVDPIDAYMRFDRPLPRELSKPLDWEKNLANLSTVPIKDNHFVPLLDGDSLARRDALPKDTKH